jgi:hypothetical protein
MGRLKGITLVAAFALLLPLAAFAGSKDQAKIHILNPVQVGSSHLKPGSYEIRWNGNGPVVQVNFLQHHKVLASTQGKVIDHRTRSPYTDVVVEPLASNRQQKTIQEIDFNNRKEALLITPGPNMRNKGRMSK